MRIRVLLVIAALGAPALTSAQAQSSLPSWTVAPRAGSAAQGWPQDPLPRFNVLPLGERDLPLPRIGLPLPPIDLREPIVMREPIIMREPIVDLRDPSPAPRRHGSRGGGGIGFVAPWPYMIAVPQMVSPTAAPGTPPAGPPPIAPKGTLTLEVQPAAAQVFIDGFYVGSAEDLSGRRGGAFLEPGAHAVEIASTGYEAVSFSVNVRPNEPIVYRQDLKAIEAAPSLAPQPSSPATSRAPTTIYMIPGCYVGNVPPNDTVLKPTCDPAKTQIFKM